MTRYASSYILIRINRNVSIAVLLSVLVHILLLFLLSHYDLLSPRQQKEEQNQTLDIQLLPPPVEAPKNVSKITKKSKKTSEKRSQSKSPQALPEKALPPPPPHKEPPPTPAPPQPPAPTPSPIGAKTPPPKPVTPPIEEYTDLDSYMRASKERRRLAGDPSALNEEAAARESAEETARTKRNFQPSGTNGIFNILSLNSQSASFDFRGWKNEFSYARREFYAVDADRNTDIYRAVVRKIIEVIRGHYQGDFNWDSPRLGQVVVLSARQKDNAFLEDFLLQEFFGARGISAQ